MTDLLKNAVKNAIIGGLLYLFARYIVHLLGYDFSAVADWVFRLAIILTIIITIVQTKARQQGHLDLLDGVKVGSMATAVLSILMTLNAFLFCSYLYQDYTEDLKTNYRNMQYNNTMRKYIATTWKKDTITQGAQDTVNNAIDLNLKNNTGYYFTTGAQMKMFFFYTLFWGIMTALTVSIMAATPKDD